MIFDLVLLALIGLVYFVTGRQLSRNQKAMTELESKLTMLDYWFRANSQKERKP